MTGIVKGLFGGESDAEEILRQFRPAGFNAPGLRGRFANNTFSLMRTPATRRALADLRAGFAGRSDVLRRRSSALLGQRGTLTGLRGELGELRPGFASLRSRLRGLQPGLETLRGDLRGLRPGLEGLRGDIRGLREELRPGFGRLTRSRVRALRGRGERAVGNLREQLAQRRVAGSSFAESQVGGLEAEFAREEDRIRAEAMLQEIDATNQLIQQELGIFGAEAELIGREGALIDEQGNLIDQEGNIIAREADLVNQQSAIAMQEAGLTDLSFQSLTQAFDSAIASAQSAVQQLNLETGLAAGLSQTASQLMNANLTAQAEARAAMEVGAMNFLSDVIGAFIGSDIFESGE